MDVGLQKAMTLQPGRGYVEALAGVSSADGPFARVEAVIHPAPSFGAFAYGQVDRTGYQAGVGGRLSF